MSATSDGSGQSITHGAATSTGAAIEPASGVKSHASRSKLRGQAPPRNLIADGLRGIAAMLVVVYHMHINAEPMFRGAEPAWLVSLIGSFGAAGVNMFFVLSGFVIALSLRSAALSWRYAGLFALRRSIRLDPPYWFAIVMSLAMAKISAVLFTELAGRGQVDGGQLLAHLFYLQNILGFGDISAVFWTLCIEVQFYLFFVGAMTLVSKLTGARGSGTTAVAVAAVVSCVSCISLLMQLLQLKFPIEGFFLRYWHMFALGAITCWYRYGDLSHRWLWGAVAGEALLVATQVSLPHLTPLIAAGALASSAAGPALAWLTREPWQYFGRISYSVYLTHGVIGWSTISVLKRIFGTSGGVLQGVLFMAIGVASSVLAAEILYRLLERPAIRFSKRVRMPSAPQRGMAA